ncbi:MAG: tRNA 2-thiouridine(34) synthase MnmA [Desulfomonilia bacterium]
MIAVALSGGVDSAAAALILHEQGEQIIGVTLYLHEGIPARGQLERAGRLCRHLGITHHVLDARREFASITDYFAREYLSGRTPNPCVACNRDIKFRHFRNHAISLGADMMATGHYVRRVFGNGRHYLLRAREKNSQEYFLGLLPQESILHCLFPLGEIPRSQAQELVNGCGIKIPGPHSSQDVCFVPRGDYVSFIRSSTGHEPVPGCILDPEGRILGTHRGVVRYTPGQRKGLGTGFGRKVYVFTKDTKNNTITVGDRSQWPYTGFIVREMNFMRAASIRDELVVRAKVRYRQEPQRAHIRPAGGRTFEVAYAGICAPGQLAVFYDRQNAILAAGIIDTLVTNPHSPGQGHNEGW